MSAFEKRLPRESFTKKLVKICERLERSSGETIRWRQRYIPGIPSTDIKIKKIWAVGSYARGALTCGDLDLVIEFEKEGKYWPPKKIITKQFFGNVQYTSMYGGTPEDNDSGVAFPDSVEIWTGPGCEWRKAIDSIVPDSSAGRASRPSDVIPLKLSQLNTSFKDIDEVIKLLADGVLESEFVPFSDEHFELPVDESKKEMLARDHYPSLGISTRKILPAIFNVVAEKDHFLNYKIKERSELRCGGTRVFVGKPYIPNLKTLDDLSVRQLAMVPHLTAKGPNGIWFLRRGPNHPLVQSFNNKKAMVMTINGKPSHVENISYLRGRGNSLSTIVLFTNEKLAKRYLKDCNDGVDIGDKYFYSMTEFSGKDLHDAISGSDYLEINNNDYALNSHSAFNLAIEQSSNSSILKKLSRTEVKESLEGNITKVRHKITDSPSFG